MGYRSLAAAEPLSPLLSSAAVAALSLLVQGGTIQPQPESEVKAVPQDLEAAKKAGKVGAFLSCIRLVVSVTDLSLHS